MKKYLIIILKSIGAFILLLLIIIIISLPMIHFRFSDQAYLSYFKKQDLVAEINYSNELPNQIRSVSIGNSNQQSLIFLHGAPGSNRDFKKYLSDSDLLGKFYMQAIDRPGYGYSNYGVHENSIKKQAEIISSVLDSNCIVVGHSYGGPVAAALAMYFPEKVKKLILLAPAIDPKHEKQFAFNQVLKLQPIKWILSGAMKVALEEKLSHEEALEELMDDWDNITCPVTILHGKKDNIVPIENVDFLKKMLTNTTLKVINPEKMDHIMIWTDFEGVKAILLED